MKGVLFGTGTGSESRDEDRRHFFQEIDKGVHRLLKDQSAPLVLAGVEYEVALYRKVNTYPRLLDEAVHGAAESLNGEMFDRARAIVLNGSPDALRTALEHLDDHRGSGRVSFDPAKILEAAQNGRVWYLLVGERDGEDDNVNAAVIETLLHGGQVFSLSPPQMPDGAAMAAAMRY